MLLSKISRKKEGKEWVSVIYSSHRQLLLCLLTDGCRPHFAALARCGTQLPACRARAGGGKAREVALSFLSTRHRLSIIFLLHCLQPAPLARHRKSSEPQQLPPICLTLCSASPLRTPRAYSRCHSLSEHANASFFLAHEQSTAVAARLTEVSVFHRIPRLFE